LASLCGMIGGGHDSRDERGGVVGAVAAVAVALLVGLAGGYATGVLIEPEPTSTETVPLEAASPSVPFTPYSADVLYPSWQPDLNYRRVRFESGAFAWTYEVPRGWEGIHGTPTEYKWGPPGHPTGSYGYRIELVLGDHATPAGQVAGKLLALRAAAGVTEVRVLDQTSDTLAVTYRALPQNWLRYNTFRWFAEPGSSTAAVEISVNGRAQDQEGMTDLLERVSSTLERG